MFFICIYYLERIIELWETTINQFLALDVSSCPTILTSIVYWFYQFCYLLRILVLSGCSNLGSLNDLTFRTTGYIRSITLWVSYNNSSWCYFEKLNIRYCTKLNECCLCWILLSLNVFAWHLLVFFFFFLAFELR